VDLRARIPRRLRRPPEQLGLVLTALVLLCLFTGLAALLDIQHRRTILEGVAGRSSPLAGAALTVYQSLSDADAVATSAFLAGEQATPESRDRYRDDITAAANALTTAAAGAPDAQTAAQVARLTAQLPMYTGIVEVANTNNLQELSVGAAYLREASELARNQMLPVAQQLYQAEIERLAAAQDDAGSGAWVPITVGVLTLLALGAAQFYLHRTTNRTLNAGLLVASATVLAAVIWLSFASLNALSHNDSSRTDGSAQLEALAEARIGALTARSNEALSLVARGGGQEYTKRFQDNSQRLDGTGLGSFSAARERISQPDTVSILDSAIATWTKWRDGNKHLREIENDGDYEGAVLIATGVQISPQAGVPAVVKPDNTGALSTELDRKLHEAVSQAQARFDDQSAKAIGSLTAADVGIAVLTLLACAGIAVGMAPRIREYR
jgi:hypothetical protein